MAAPAPPTEVRPANPPEPAPVPPQVPPPGYGPPSYGHVPPAGPELSGQYPPQPQHFGGYGAPSGPKRSKLWLWVTLAVVLLLAVGTGVTLGVVQPWGDHVDEGSTAGDPDDGGGGEARAGDATQGDVNGDGKGDAVYYVHLDYDNVKKVTATSNGEIFETSELAVNPYTEPEELFFDWDADGVNEKLTWTFVGSGDQITLSSSDRDFPGEQTHTMSLSTLKEYGDIEIQVVDGDFDGDGDQDLAIAGPNDKVVDVSVMLNDGTGTFAAPVLWRSIPNAVIDSTTVRAGDFDNDGDDDIWAELPAEKLTDKDYSGYYSGDRGYALMKSDGRNFELGAVNESGVHHDGLLVGDITGDGTDHIVAIEASSYDEEATVTVYDFSSGQLKEVSGFTGTTKIGRRNLQGATLSDVDGDGKGDVVFVVKSYEESKFTGVQVMKSTGTIFESATVWAETPTCPDEKCRIEFASTGRY